MYQKRKIHEADPTKLPCSVQTSYVRQVVCRAGISEVEFWGKRTSVTGRQVCSMQDEVGVDVHIALPHPGFVTLNLSLQF